MRQIEYVAFTQTKRDRTDVSAAGRRGKVRMKLHKHVLGDPAYNDQNESWG
jgi:hypothetical protein